MSMSDKHILVLHGPAYQAWTEVFKTLTQQDWTVHHCESDVGLASRLGQVSGTLVLCVGSIESLTLRPGELLPWLVHRGVTCCACATRLSPWDMIEQVQAVGVSVFTRPEAFKVWVGHLSKTLQGQTPESKYVNHTVSDAELAALFGDEGDE